MDTMLGFDKEVFQKSESTHFRYLNDHLKNGPVYSVAETTDTPFFFAEWAKCLLIFQIKPEEFKIKERFFSGEKTLNWNHLRRIARNTMKMSNQEIQQSDVRITALTLYDIFGGYTSKNFTDDLRLQFENANIEKVFAKKFELDQCSSYIKLRKLLYEADINDPLYNEIKFEARRTQQMYQKKEQEFAHELHEFRNRLRANDQLSTLSQLVS